MRQMRAWRPSGLSGRPFVLASILSCACGQPADHAGSAASSPPSAELAAPSVNAGTPGKPLGSTAGTSSTAGRSGLPSGGAAASATTLPLNAGAAASAGSYAMVTSGAGAAATAGASAAIGGTVAAGSPALAGMNAGGQPGGGSAGTAGSTDDVCGARSTTPEAATPKAVVLHGLVEYHTADANEFVGVHATQIVPAKPPAGGVIFAWPGTQAFADSDTYAPVLGGVLQPVLTWGQSCVPGALPGHSTWWISPVYVNSETSIPELRGCHGGPVITVDVGDRLDLDMRLDGTNWDQTVVDLSSQKMTKFRIDLRGQRQQRALFWIELKTSAKPTEDVIFEDIVLTMRMPEPGACALNNGGMNDYVSKSRVSADGLHCCIDRIVLRAEGVPASTKNP